MNEAAFSVTAQALFTVGLVAVACTWAVAFLIAVRGSYS